MSVDLEHERPKDYLERLATSDVGRSYKRLALEALALRDGHRVVDLGCGPGTDLSELAESVGTNGTVVGVDHDAEAVSQARARLSGDPRVTVVERDIHDPGLAPCSVDRIRTDRVLQHVANPQVVVRETSRALRAGGRAVFAEPDWGTLAVDPPDAHLAEDYRRFVVEEVVANATVGRQLPRLASAAGLSVTGVDTVTALFRDVQAADRVLGFARVTQRATDAGRLDDDAARRWLDHLVTGPFFASLTMVVTAAVRDE